MKKRILALVAVLALVGALVPGSVFAATTGTVNCTVSAVLVSLTVTDGSVDYGTVALNATKNTAEYNGSNNSNGSATEQTQTITNTGTVNENFNIKTSNANGGTNWTVAASAGSNLFTHAYNISATHYFGSGTITFTKWIAADTYALNVSANVAPAGVRYLELQIGMPTSVADYTEHTITVTVQAVQA